MPGFPQLEKMEKKVIKEQTLCVEYTYKCITLKLLLHSYTYKKFGSICDVYTTLRYNIIQTECLTDAKL